MLNLTDVEHSVAIGGLQAHFHWLVVLRCCADVPVGEGNRHEGADVHPGGLSVEEKSHHVAVRADPRQTVCLHNLKMQGWLGTILAARQVKIW